MWPRTTPYIIRIGMLEAGYLFVDEIQIVVENPVVVANSSQAFIRMLLVFSSLSPNLL